MGKNKLKIKKMKQNDNIIIKELLKEDEGAQMHLEEIYRIIEKKGQVFGAFREKELVGVAALEPEQIGEKKHYAQLKFFYVAKAKRREGVGKKLLAHIGDVSGYVGGDILFVSGQVSEDAIGFLLSQKFVAAEHSQLGKDTDLQAVGANYILETEHAKHRGMYYGMSIGMLLGISVGLMFGQTFYESEGIGMSMGMAIGMCIGMAIGASYDESKKKKEEDERE